MSGAIEKLLIYERPIDVKRDIKTREDLELLLSRFYEVATKDNLIGHYFNEVVQLNLEVHLPVIVNFWEKVLFAEPIYFGNPMAVHKKLHEKSPFEKTHFDRWVEIFEQTVDKLFDGIVADKAKTKVNVIAQSLLQGVLQPESNLSIVQA